MAANISGDAEYELRLIVVPAVYAQAVWLMNLADAAGDKFIVVNAGEMFESGARLDTDTWYGALRAEAQRALQ